LHSLGVAALTSMLCWVLVNFTLQEGWPLSPLATPRSPSIAPSSAHTSSPVVLSKENVNAPFCSLSSRRPHPFSVMYSPGCRASPAAACAAATDGRSLLLAWLGAGDGGCAEHAVVESAAIAEQASHAIFRGGVFAMSLHQYCLPCCSLACYPILRQVGALLPHWSTLLSMPRSADALLASGGWLVQHPSGKYARRLSAVSNLPDLPSAIRGGRTPSEWGAPPAGSGRLH